MNKLLKKWLPNCIRDKIFQYINRPKYNVFQTDYSRTVLISYLVKPFRTKNGNFNAHTSYLEVVLMAEVLRELKYNVDVVDYRNDSKLNYEKYDLIIGFGNSFKDSFSGSQDICRILYTTGTNQCFQNKAELERLKNLYTRKGVWLKPRRIINESWTDYAVVSDAVLSTGNDFTMSTFDNFNHSNIYKLTLPVHKTNKSFIERNFKQAKNHFLWFGSSGLVHKGLDLCIEYFVKNPQYTLHICGPKENDFFELYQKELDTKNIIYHGRVDIESKVFEEIVNQCLFAIFPSCSEGGGAALLTVMATGLIPIATIEASVDLNNYGYLIEQANESGINNTVINAVNDSIEILQTKSQQSSLYVHNTFTKIGFKESLKYALNEVLKRKK